VGIDDDVMAEVSSSGAAAPVEQSSSVRMGLLWLRLESRAPSRIQLWKIHDGSGNPIATNDDWKEARQVQIEAIGLPPADDREAAILATPPGATRRLFEARPERLESLCWKFIFCPEYV